MPAKLTSIKTTIIINRIVERLLHKITWSVCCISSQCYCALFVYEWHLFKNYQV